MIRALFSGGLIGLASDALKLVIFIGGPLACLKWRNEPRRPDPHAAPHGDVPHMGD